MKILVCLNMVITFSVAEMMLSIRLRAICTQPCTDTSQIEKRIYVDDKGIPL